jgi:MoaA/NifB/PqqE/SkfB family radical SAM enzyme
MITLDQVNSINVELTTKCQASCPRCHRNDWGYKTRKDFPIVETTVANWIKIFESAELPNLTRLVFNGNFGEPFITKDIIEIIDYSLDKWPNVLLDFSTNGGVRTPAWWEALGKRYSNKNLQIRFGIDGLADTHELHRINVPYEKVIANATAFIKGGGQAIWMFLLFKHNEHQLEEITELSKKLGFHSLRVKRNGKTGWVFTSDTDGYWIEPASTDLKRNVPEKPEVYSPDVRTNLNHFTSREKLWVKNGRTLDCFSSRSKSIYLAGDGTVYPCHWVGEYPKTFQFNNFDQVIGEANNNAIAVGLEKATEWFTKVESSWTKKSMRDGILAECLGCTKNSFHEN